MKKLGKITVICGSMFAGKTEELIRLARRALYAQRKVQVFKPTTDKRYDEQMVVTHHGQMHEAVAVISVQEMEQLVKDDTDLICIEEAQFFDVGLVSQVVSWADAGKEIVIAGLDQDFRRQPFGPMPTLLAVADEVVKLRAICMKCGAPASHTYRQVNGGPARDDDPIVLIGALESYEARCRNCYALRRSKRPNSPAKPSGRRTV